MGKCSHHIVEEEKNHRSEDFHYLTILDANQRDLHFFVGPLLTLPNVTHYLFHSDAFFSVCKTTQRTAL